ncbi:MAG: LytTR family DNA-binding domain-containing protein [Microscillaceae bacterium]|jgi:two-component system LytT family response regulator|nr:LytTR family DNA-binding domain-containing protein [Microscillaceae bacterium]
MDTMQVLIIEDEAPASRRLKNLIQEIDNQINIVSIIDSIEETIEYLKSNPTPALIFMDIQLADGLSFSIFEQIKVEAPIIFTTAYDEYTMQAFKVNSIDYLLKPIKKEELTASLQKYQSFKNQFSQSLDNQGINLQTLLKSFQNKVVKEYKSRFLVKLGERLISVPESDIAYFHADSKIVLLVTRDHKKYALDYSLDELENQLNPTNFYRLNRQYYVHFESIQAVHNYFNGKLKIILRPETKEEVTVSREKSSDFKQWLDK